MYYACAIRASVLLYLILNWRATQLYVEQIVNHYYSVISAASFTYILMRT